MIKGRCNCGDVRFDIRSEVSDVFVCHCSICRRATGSNGIAVVLVNKANFHWVAGEDNIRHWQKPAADWMMGFCRTCGSPAPGTNDAEQLFVPAGLLDESDLALTVTHHIYVDSKASWDKIGDEGQQHPDAFNGEVKKNS